MSRAPAKRYPIDREKLHHALWKRGQTMTSETRDNYYSQGWLHAMAGKGYVNEAAMTVLRKYGINEEDIRP